MKCYISLFGILTLLAAVVCFLFCLKSPPPDKTPVSPPSMEQAPVTAERLLEVPTICQYPDLPTGCESVAATMVLQYYHVDITANEFARNWLTCSSEFYYSSDDRLYGPDPHAVFAGDPFSENSYGCFATPIVNAINDNSAECTATKITGRPLDALCDEFIANGKPLLIWATMGMKKSKKGNSWYLSDGSKFTWIAGEHCLVLVGYDENDYFLNDPQSGRTVAYQKEVVEQRFAELGQQAVYIERHEG